MTDFYWKDGFEIQLSMRLELIFFRNVEKIKEKSLHSFLSLRWSTIIFRKKSQKQVLKKSFKNLLNSTITRDLQANPIYQKSKPTQVQIITNHFSWSWDVSWISNLSNPPKRQIIFPIQKEADLCFWRSWLMKIYRFYDFIVNRLNF